MTDLSPPQMIPVIAAAAIAAALAFAVPAGAHGARPVPDAEIFATNNTAVITDPTTRGCDDRLSGFARRVERIIERRRRPRRAARSCSTACSSPPTSAPRRSSARAASTSTASTTTSCTTIAETIRRRFLQQSVLTFDHLRRGDPDVDAIELEVPGVTADALRDGLLADPEARERLFGGSVTLDGHLLLVADLADAELARAFAKRIGGDLSAP